MYQFYTVHFLVTFLFFNVGELLGQNEFNAVVIDSSTYAPIPYVNIGIMNKAIGTVSDNDGYFSLTGISIEDKVIFSSIGYEKKYILARNTSKLDTIFLVSRRYELDQIEITSFKFHSQDKVLGVRNKNRGHSIAFGSAQRGTELGAPINIQRPTYIKSANFVLNHAKGDSLHFRVNIYHLENGKVGTNILSENIFIKEKQKKGTITINMRPYELILDSDVLLSLEWIRDYDELGNKAITFDTKKGKKLKGVYARYASNSSFMNVAHKTKVVPCFYFIGQEVID